MSRNIFVRKAFLIKKNKVGENKVGKICDCMIPRIASRIIKKLISNNVDILRSNILILGFQSDELGLALLDDEIVLLCEELKSYGVDVNVYDPRVDSKDIYEKLGINVVFNVGELFTKVPQKDDHRLPQSQVVYNAIVYDGADIGWIDKAIFDEIIKNQTCFNFKGEVLP